jgi:hypothetical protein
VPFSLDDKNSGTLEPARLQVLQSSVVCEGDDGGEDDDEAHRVGAGEEEDGVHWSLPERERRLGSGRPTCESVEVLLPDGQAAKCYARSMRAVKTENL